ncbi:MAG: MBOAT family O-acyltransferase, partial [Oscillospiraceae bacterium]
YLYIPLGGNRKGKIRKYCNILAVFFASGLWHGANVTFIVWGVLNGIFQIAEDILHVNTKERINPFIRAFKICFTFLLVDFTWLFFRAENMEHAIGLIRRITGQFFCNIEFSFPGAINLMRDMGANTSRTVWIIFAIVILLLIDYLHEKDISISASIQTLPSFARWSIYLVACEVLIYNWICNFGVAAEQFIYFQF